MQDGSNIYKWRSSSVFMLKIKSKNKMKKKTIFSDTSKV